MARRSLSISISIPIEMDEMIEEEKEKYGMTYSEYVREAIRGYSPTPFDQVNDPVLCKDENGEDRRNEGAA